MALLQVIATNDYSCSAASRLGLVSWPVTVRPCRLGAFWLLAKTGRGTSYAGKVAEPKVEPGCCNGSESGGTGL